MSPKHDKHTMMTLAQAAEALGAKRLGPNAAFSAVSTDSRKIGAGELFIALRGENFDGAEFAPVALESGAAAVMINADSYAADPARFEPEAPLLLVEDTRLALGKLAAWWRNRFDIPVAAITGSNGKTTVKEMLAAILRATSGKEDAVLATKGNLNNDIGMPLTLLQLNAGHRYAVIEMGMNHPGEIDYLTRLACPDVALINNASGAHLEGLGTVEDVARAKGEIFTGLGEHGTAIINADDPHAPLWRRLADTRELLEFGMDGSADISGLWHPEGPGLHLDVQTPQGSFGMKLQVPGAHNARNALAATAAAIALNVPLATIANALANFTGVSGRLQRKPGKRGATLIDDTYNANPASMLAAIDVLAQAGGKRVFVLGDMGELGAGAAGFHAEIGQAAKRAGIDRLFALGELSRGATAEFGKEARHFDSLDALLAELDKELDANVTVLVKGSRFMKMERVVQACMAERE